ncbi:MAG: 4-hydroxy-3-methylbut-2-enyl diphosphate reductase [Mycoplasma sp.]
MIVKKILPTGFCYGVMKSYNETKKIVLQNPDKKIYMLGWLVHNEVVIEELRDMGIEILDDTNESRFEIISKFSDQENSILILSAHGTDSNVIEIAHQKGFQIFDLTCKYVYKTHELIKTKIQEGYEIIFVGKQNHPETEAILAIDEKIILVSDLESAKLFKSLKTKTFCTNQTTFNASLLDEINNHLWNADNSILFANDICSATRIRQSAISKLDDDIDISIIIGDKKSSNANELFEISSKYKESYFVSKVSDLNLEWFKNKKVCAISGAASTPISTIEEFYKVISNI